MLRSDKQAVGRNSQRFRHRTFHTTAFGGTALRSALRATTLIVVAAVLSLSGCAGPSHYFRWADEPNARIKANLGEGDIAIVRNCVVRNLTPDSRSAEDKIMTVTNGGVANWACFITRDQKLIIVSPLDSPASIRLTLSESLPWFAYRTRTPFRHVSGYWFHDASAPPNNAERFVSFREAPEDGDGSGNNTVFNYLINHLRLVPKEAPPTRVRFLFSAKYIGSETVLP